MIKTKTFKKIGVAFAPVLLSVLAFSLAFAGSSVTLNGYQIDFVNVEKNGDQSTWTYAITADGDETFGLSHWALEVCPEAGYTIVAPSEGPYDTPTNLSVCSDGTYNCLFTTYVVEYGADPALGFTGIKFNDATEPLERDNPGTHIFQITLAKPGEHYSNDVYVGIKAGTSSEIDKITGPLGTGTAVSSGGIIKVSTCDEVPTAVELTSFKAKPKKGDILVRWETATEIDNLGFNLYRAESPDGSWTQLNDSLIPSQVPPGSPVGAVYKVRDTRVQMGVTYYYRLEQVDVTGQNTFYGPVDAQIKPRQPRSGAPNLVGGGR